ncbi:hypothetical protein ACFYWY_14625 [Streptomyces sp. NPDC002870]
MSAVVLYGPPTSGKDTVTAALRVTDPRFGATPAQRAGDAS